MITWNPGNLDQYDENPLCNSIQLLKTDDSYMYL